MTASSAPLFKIRLVVYFLAFALAIVSIASVFHAQHETGIVKAKAQAGVSKITPGVTVYIGTSDVWNAGVAEGIANLFLGATAGFAILTLLFATSLPRFLRKAMLPLLLALWSITTIFVLVTSIITTVFVTTRQAKVSAYLPNGTRLPDTLVQAFSKQLGMSPVYTSFGYLKFMTIVTWFSFVLAVASTILTIIAWRQSASVSTDAEVTEMRDTAAAERHGDVGSAEAITEKERF